MAGKSNFLLRAGLDFSALIKGLQKTQDSLKKFQNNLKKSTDSMKNSLIGFAKVAAAAFSIRAIWNFGKESIEAANKSEAAWLGLRSVVEGMGGSFNQAQSYIKKFISDGLVPATNAAAAYKNLISAGYDVSQIEDIMKAFKNSAVYSRQAGLTIGEAVQTATEGLKNLNSVNVDNAGVTKNLSVMQKEYAASIGKTVGNLTDAEIRMAHYRGIMEATKVQMNDAANYTTTYAGRIAMLSASFTALKEAVGSIVQYFVSYLLPVMQRGIDVTTNFVNTIRRFLGIKEITASGGISDGVASIADNAGDAADGLEDTAAAAKKVKNALVGIDEINTLQMPDTTSGGSGGGLDAGSGGLMDGAAFESDAIGMEVPLELDNGIFDKIKEVIESIKEALTPTFNELQKLGDVLKEIGGFAWDGLKDFYSSFLEPVGAWLFAEDSGIAKFIRVLREMLEKINWGKINDSLHGLWEALSKFTIQIGDGLLWLWENVLAPFGTWVVSDVLPVFLEILANAIRVLSEVIDALKPLALWLWESFLRPLAEWTGGVIVNVLQMIADALGSFADWIKANQALVEGFAIVIGSFFAAWKIVGFAQMVGAIITSLISFITTGGLAAAVSGALGAAIAFLTSPITLAIAGIAALIAITILLVRNWDTVKKVASDLWDSIVDTFSKAGSWFKSKVVEPIVNFFEPIVDKVSGFFSNLWGNITGIFISAATWFKESVIDKLIEVFVPIISKVGEIFAKLWEIITVLFSVAANWFKDTFIQPLISYFNDKLLPETMRIFNNIWNGITEIFKSASIWFSARFTEVWEAIKRVFEPVGAFFTNVWEVIKGSFIKIGTTIGNAVGDAFKYVVNSIIGFAETTINGFIKSINRAISMINNIPGVNISPLAPLSVPKLAKGGILDSPTLAMISEAGKEAVVPLENNPEWMDILGSIVTNAVTSAVSAMTLNSSSGDKEVVMNLDGAAVARAIIPHITDNIRRTGVKLA